MQYTKRQARRRAFASIAAVTACTAAAVASALFGATPLAVLRGVGAEAADATKRSLNSSEFGRKPNQHLWKYLTSSNVKWFVVDVAAGRVTDSWEPFATVVFQNSEMKILKLKLMV